MANKLNVLVNDKVTALEDTIADVKKEFEKYWEINNPLAAFNPVKCLPELKAQAVEAAAEHFVEQGEASVEELQAFADTFRQEKHHG